MKILKPIHPNRGIEARYRRRLMALIADMHASYDYWIAAAYRKEPPRVAELAQDAVPSKYVNKVLIELGKRWLKKFEDLAPDLAKNQITDQFKVTDGAFQQALKDAGFSIKFTMTPAVRDALNAIVMENVSLIRSIPVHFATQVEGAVMRSYSRGAGLHEMVKDIKAIYPVTQRRAELIARDQTSKANGAATRVRQMQLGIKQAKWIHSGGGKEPRKSHEAANGKIYDIDKGCLIDGEYIFPGELINCRCACRAILPM